MGKSKFAQQLAALQGVWQERQGRTWTVEGDYAVVQVGASKRKHKLNQGENGGGLVWGKGDIVPAANFKKGSETIDWVKDDKVAFSWSWVGAAGAVAAAVPLSAVEGMAERRIDPADGAAYTWEEFSKFYKGTYKKTALAAYWDTCKIKKTRSKASKSKEAASAKKDDAGAKEKRVLPEDGKAYTFEELNSYYKGKYKRSQIVAYWNTCKLQAKSKAAAATAASVKEEKRIEPSDGKAYTLQEFSAFYKGHFKKAAVAEYFKACKLAKAQPKEKAKAKAKPKEKAKAKPKAKPNATQSEG